MSDATTISVSGDATYDITVGHGILSSLGEALPPAARKVLVIHPPTLAAQAEALRASLAGDREVLLAEIPDAEQGKRIEVAAFCWQVMGQADFTRTDAVDVVYWPTLDPTAVEGSRETKLDAYRGVRDGLVRRIRELLGAMRPMGSV